MYGNDGRHKVAQAWAAGRAWSQGNVSTNGQDVYSYNHVVGITLRTGEKIAFCCHYSVTTAKHCSAFKGVATIVQPCAPHSRPVRTKYQSVCDCCRRHHPDYQAQAS